MAQATAAAQVVSAVAGLVLQTLFLDRRMSVARSIRKSSAASFVGISTK
jgi:hypothetical protein